MFDSLLNYERTIISNISIIGFEEKEIINLKEEIFTKGSLKCLYCIPDNEKEKMNNEIIFEMIFPEKKIEKKYKIESPKFFSLTLTDEYGNFSYLYCLKFPENYKLNNNKNIILPLIITIKSTKYDYESFKNLLFIIQQIMISNKNDNLYDYETRNNSKKVELLNLFYYLLTLIKPPPHSNIQLTIKSKFLKKKTKKINFYFSSNCEIPCNENDKDINILFYTLDESIIVKLIISILMEKQIIIRSSQVNLLHLIIPAILKLIFPFKWIHSFIPVLPYSNIELLDKPGSYIFGILSDNISFNQMMNDFPGRVVVDCDINEIFGDNNFKPYSFNNNNNINENNNIIHQLNYGFNNIYLDNNSKIFKVDEKNNKKIKIQWNENLLFIDCKNSQIMEDNDNKLINRKYFKWLRKKIQIIKNPEIFDIGNLDFKEEKKKNKENPINVNRPLSYNIQNIFLLFFKKIMEDKEYNFFKEFEKTNLYINFNENKKYESDHGKNILKNIEETKNDQRYFNNSFLINYSMKIFPAKEFLKIKENKYENLTKIFENYLKVNDIEINNENNKFLFNDTIINTNQFYGHNFSKSILKNENIQKHVKNQTSVLEQTSFNNKMDILINDNEPFLFYHENGFLNFLEEINNLCKEKQINLNLMINYNKIEEQIEKILLEEKYISDIFCPENNINYSSEENINLNNNKIVIIEEKEDEKSENEDLIVNTSNINLENSFINKEELNSYDKLIDKNNIEEENILNFILFNNENNKNFNFNHKLQYYLFIAFILEEIKSNKQYEKNLLEKYPDLNILNLILKLYIKAYESGDKREYPYYIYYNFLNKLTYEEIEKINIIEEKHLDLYEIYLNEKKLRNQKKKSLNKEKKKISTIKEKKEEKGKEKEKENLDFMKEKIIINSYKNKIFEIHGYPNLDFYFSTLPTLIIKSMPSTKEINLKSKEEIINETNLKMQNSGIIEIISELRLVNPIKLKTIKERIVFWVNIFNSLLLFTIFYQKIDLNNENQWKKFFQNIYFDIGGNNYSFNDIQYILFNKLIFINEKYIPEKYVKECSIENLRKIRTKSSPFFFERNSDNKISLNNNNNNNNNNSININIENYNSNQDFHVSFFSLYIPNKTLLNPIIFSIEKIQEEMEFKDKEYFQFFIEKDSSNNLIIPEFLLNVEGNFTDEYNLIDYYHFIDKDMYNFIKDKKYNKIIKIKTNWKLDFSFLNEGFNKMK